MTSLFFGVYCLNSRILTIRFIFIFMFMPFPLFIRNILF